MADSTTPPTSPPQDLTPTGAEMVALLPQRLFDSPVYWMVPVAVLIVFLVRG